MDILGSRVELIDTCSLGLNSRLTDRYMTLVNEHLSPAFRGAAGLRALPGTASAMAATQGAWRFFHHPKVSLPQIFAPVLSAVREEVMRHCDRYVLVSCDWCNFHYTHHQRKKDRIALSQKKDWGYETLTGLAVSDRDGQPLGPLWFELRSSDGVHATHCDQLRPAISVLDELQHNFYHTHQLELGVTPVFVIDAEADSVAHMRQCAANGYLFLIRADGINTVKFESKQQKISEIHQQLRQQAAFQTAGKVKYNKQLTEQWVAETEVVITRAARPQRQGEKRQSIPGPPLELRLVVSELRDSAGKVLAVWYLLTNVPASVSIQQIVRWYYWRWNIENYHKLLKSAGQEIEQWQQQTAAAIARRLAVASMACLIVWRLERDESEQATEVKEFLIRLSGRQMEHGKKYTAPALLAGLWVLLSMLDVIEDYDLETLRSFGKFVMPRPRPDPKRASKIV